MANMTSERTTHEWTDTYTIPVIIWKWNCVVSSWCFWEGFNSNNNMIFLVLKSHADLPTHVLIPILMGALLRRCSFCSVDLGQWAWLGDSDMLHRAENNRAFCFEPYQLLLFQCQYCVRRILPLHKLYSRTTHTRTFSTVAEQAPISNSISTMTVAEQQANDEKFGKINGKVEMRAKNQTNADHIRLYYSESE